jgi:hypothetical protein
MRLNKSTIGAVMLFAALLGACSRQRDDDSGAYVDPTGDLPSRFKTEEVVPKPDFQQAAATQEFQRLIEEASTLLDAKPQPLRSYAEDQEVPGGVSFEIAHHKIETMLRSAHVDFLKRGAYLFRCRNGYGLGNEKDVVGLLPTTNRYDVLAVMETNGDNYDIPTAGVIAWLKELESDQPFILTGIGFDYLEGHFTAPIKDPAELARRMYQFCPDIVDQGVGSVSTLTRDLRKTDQLFFWWD